VVLPAYLPMCMFVCACIISNVFFLYNNYISFTRSANSASISCCSRFMRYIYVYHYCYYYCLQPMATSTRVVPIQYNGPINKKNRFSVFPPEKITGKTAVIGGKLGEKSIRRNTACRYLLYTAQIFTANQSYS